MEVRIILPPVAFKGRVEGIGNVFESEFVWRIAHNDYDIKLHVIVKPRGQDIGICCRNHVRNLFLVDGVEWVEVLVIGPSFNLDDVQAVSLFLGNDVNLEVVKLPISFANDISALDTLNYALSAASEMGHEYVGSEHLLLGLLQAEDGAASHYLVARGAELEAVRSAIVRLSGLGTPGRATLADMTDSRKMLRYSTSASRP